MHAGMALCGKSVGRRSVKVLGCTKTVSYTSISWLFNRQGAAGSFACSQRLLRSLWKASFWSRWAWCLVLSEKVSASHCSVVPLLW